MRKAARTGPRRGPDRILAPPAPAGHADAVPGAILATCGMSGKAVPGVGPTSILPSPIPNPLYATAVISLPMALAVRPGAA